MTLVQSIHFDQINLLKKERTVALDAMKVGVFAVPDQPSSTDPLAAFGPNEWLVDELYQQYLQDKQSVDRAWWEFFEDYQPGEARANGKVTATGTSSPATTAPPAKPRREARSRSPLRSRPRPPLSPPRRPPSPPRSGPDRPAVHHGRGGPAGWRARRADHP